MLDEYRRVLLRDRFSFDRVPVGDLLEHLRAVGEHVTPEPWSGELSDPDDRPFPEVALPGRARVLVRGNEADCEPRSGTHSVTVISPRELVEHVRGE